MEDRAGGRKGERKKEREEKKEEKKGKERGHKIMFISRKLRIKIRFLTSLSRTVGGIISGVSCDGGSIPAL